MILTRNSPFVKNEYFPEYISLPLLPYVPLRKFVRFRKNFTRIVLRFAPYPVDLSPKTRYNLIDNSFKRKNCQPKMPPNKTVFWGNN